MEKLTSPQNPGIKRVARLRTKKTRDAKNLTIVEGIREVRQAHRAGLQFSQIYFCREGVYFCPDDLLAELEPLGKKLIETSCAVFDKIAYGDRKDGVVALVETPSVELDSLKLSKVPLIVVLERVEKPGNMGAVLRTADAVGADALIVCDPLCDPYSPNVVRSSLGAVFAVPTVTCTNQEARTFLKDNNVRVVVAVVDAPQDCFKSDLRGPLAVVLGSEQEGLSDFWKENSQLSLRIPMCGKVDSLNVSVSAAVILYEALRQRMEAVS